MYILLNADECMDQQGGIATRSLRCCSRRDLTSWHGKEAFESSVLQVWLFVAVAVRFSLALLCLPDSCWYVQDYLRLAQASQLRLSQSELEVVHIQSFCILGILGNFEVAMISVLPGGVSQHG